MIGAVQFGGCVVGYVDMRVSESEVVDLFAYFGGKTQERRFLSVALPSLILLVRRLNKSMRY